MKRIVIFMTLLALLATGCKREQKFTLTSDLNEARFDLKTDSLTLQSEALPTPVTVYVKDGVFSCTGELEKPAIATLRGGGIMNTTRQLILEKGTITFKNGLACGTPLNDAVYDLSQSLRKLEGDRFGDKEANAEEAVKQTREYLAKHNNDPSAVVALLAVRRFTSPQTMSELIDMTSKEVQNDGSIRRIKSQIAKVKKQAEAETGTESEAKSE